MKKIYQLNENELSQMLALISELKRIYNALEMNMNSKNITRTYTYEQLVEMYEKIDILTR